MEERLGRVIPSPGVIIGYETKIYRKFISKF